jgi:glycosyltransferase involved in cell wall biosynthesis
VLQGLRSLRLLLKALGGRRDSPDVLHSHSGTFAYALVPLACRGARVRLHSLYCPLDGEGGVYSRWWDRKFLARAVLRRLDAVITVSDNVRRSLDEARVGNGNVFKFPMTVDCSRFSPRPRPANPTYFPDEGGAARILFVGNASVEKGLRNLTDALGVLAARGLRPNVVAALENAQGVEEYERELEIVEKKLSTSGLGRQVRFVGLVNDMPELYAEADVVVIPWISTRGPSDIPMVALEAMAMGKCVVATPVGGCRELIEDGRTGLLTSDFSLSSLADALQRAICSADARIAIGEAARTLAAEFSADATALKMLELYRMVLERKRGHAK